MIKKRCPSCNKEVKVNPSHEKGICEACGEVYLISHTLSSGKVGNSSGIRLKLAKKTKLCPKCGEERPLRSFKYSTYSDSEFSTVCINCNREINKAAFGGKYSVYRGRISA